MADDDPNWTGYIGVAGEGARFGIVACKRCGVGVMIGFKDEDHVGEHNDWHDYLDRMLGGVAFSEHAAPTGREEEGR